MFAADTTSACRPPVEQANVDSEQVRAPTFDRQQGIDVLDAARAGNWSSLSALLSVLTNANANINNIFDDEGRTALHLAAGAGSVACVEALLKEGVNVDVADRSGYRPIHIAAQQDQLAALKVLLSHRADVRVQNSNELTALQLAAQLGHTACMRELLGAGADVEADGGGWTSLQLAAGRGSKSAIALLLHAGALVNAGNDENALDLAKHSGHAEAAELLRRWVNMLSGKFQPACS